jgi:hypothetical protein
MHVQYVQYMREVDVTDQLRGNYSSQLKFYKWWLKLFHLVVNQSMVNNYVCWVADMEALELRVMSHLAFKIAVGKPSCGMASLQFGLKVSSETLPTLHK